MQSINFVLCCFFVICTASPSDPQPRTDEWWVQRHALFKENTASNPDIPIVFYGDSITEGWNGNGRNIFDQFYAPLDVANYGIGADRTEHLIFRILNDEVKGLNPKLVVLKIGTNNLGLHSNQPIIKGIINVVGTLRHQLPNTKVLLLGILPRNGVTNFDRIVEINRSIGRLHDGENIFFLDMFDTFSSDVWGAVPDNLFYDGLHLSAAGYQLWADTMNPLFYQLIE